MLEKVAKGRSNKKEKSRVQKEERGGFPQRLILTKTNSTVLELQFQKAYG